METSTQQSDHDLLVTLVAKVDAFIAGQVASQNDHESRLRVLEQGAISQKGTSDGRREMSTTVKSVISILIATVAAATTVIGVLVAQK